MAIYVYRCVNCGPFEVARPMGEASDAEPCRVCACGVHSVLTQNHRSVRRSPDDASVTEQLPDTWFSHDRPLLVEILRHIDSRIAVFPSLSFLRWLSGVRSP